MLTTAKAQEGSQVCLKVRFKQVRPVALKVWFLDQQHPWELAGNANSQVPPQVESDWVGPDNLYCNKPSKFESH